MFKGVKHLTNMLILDFPCNTYSKEFNDMLYLSPPLQNPTLIPTSIYPIIHLIYYPILSTLLSTLYRQPRNR